MMRPGSRWLVGLALQTVGLSPCGVPGPEGGDIRRNNP